MTIINRNTKKLPKWVVILVVKNLINLKFSYKTNILASRLGFQGEILVSVRNNLIFS